MNICPICGEKFLPPFGRKSYYCSEKCRKEARHRQHKEAQDRVNQQWKKPKAVTKSRKIKCHSQKEQEEEIHKYCLWQAEQKKQGKRGSWGDWQKAKFFGEV